MNHFMTIEGKKSPPNHLPPHQVTGSAVQGTHRGQVFRVLSSVSSVLLLRGTTGAWKRRELDSLLWGIFVGARKRRKRSGIALYGEYLLPPQEHGKEETRTSLLWGIFCTTTTSHLSISQLLLNTMLLSLICFLRLSEKSPYVI